MQNCAARSKLTLHIFVASYYMGGGYKLFKLRRGSISIVGRQIEIRLKGLTSSLPQMGGNNCNLMMENLNANIIHLMKILFTVESVGNVLPGHFGL